MPTPFMHLATAEKIRHSLMENPDHDGRNGRLAALLTAEWPAFYLGNVAPDFQDVANLPREATHFYRLPLAKGKLADKLMLVQYPQLADATQMPTAQAVFVAGYCAHLMLDIVWVHEVVLKMYANPSRFGTRWEATLKLLIFLAYLDGFAMKALPDSAGETLAEAKPKSWLPFGSDDDLVRWRDILVCQLKPAGSVQTNAIYARRLGISTTEFEAYLYDSEWMQANLFEKFNVKAVQARLETAVNESVELLHAYLSGSRE